MPPDVMLGDFNLVEDSINRLPSNADNPQSVELLRNLKIKYNLVDGWQKANPEEKGYMWSRDSNGTQSRIDCIYVHEDLFDTCSGWKIMPTSIPSDHDMISANISMPTAPTIGRGRWAVPLWLFKNRTIKKEIQELGCELQKNLDANQPRSPSRNPQTILKQFKTRVRNSLRNHDTGGKGAFTQWVWVELIESTETICLANTHQVHAEFI